MKKNIIIENLTPRQASVLYELVLNAEQWQIINPLKKRILKKIEKAIKTSEDVKGDKNV